MIVDNIDVKMLEDVVGFSVSEREGMCADYMNNGKNFTFERQVFKHLKDKSSDMITVEQSQSKI